MLLKLYNEYDILYIEIKRGDSLKCRRVFIMIKAVKGFNKDMICRGFQYQEGKEYEMENASLCNEGFHACLNPLDCFKYYSPGDGSVYREVEIDDNGERGADSKVVGTKIKIGVKLDAAKICKLHFEFVKNQAIQKKDGRNISSLAAQDRSSLAAHDMSSLAAQHSSSLAAQDWSSLAARNSSSLAAQDSSSLAAQDSSSLAAQDMSSLAARNSSSLAAQDRSSLAAGKNSVLACFNGRCCAGLNSLIAIANRKWNGNDYEVTDFKAGIVDGEKIKADTWYKLINSEFVEVDDNEV